jgi:hypothetical protein
MDDWTRIKNFTKINYLLFVGILILLYSSCADKKIAAFYTPAQNKEAVDFTNYDLNRLLEVKNEITIADADLHKIYKKILAEADDCMDKKPRSVMDKTGIAASGDKHDYYSLGPYWWPDPTKADGLPWIRKDGEVNPLTKNKNVDDPTKDEIFDAISVLSKAYFFSGEKKYAEKAQDFIYTWFVNPETKMNPNLNYAQGIPGRNDGRCFGIIEFTSISGIISSLEMLDYYNGIDKKNYNVTKAWIKDFQHWLLSSELGIQEQTRSNNHATWYDNQVVGIYIFLNQEEKAKLYLEKVTKPRIAKQIEPDGSQPHELARTKSLSYSTMNLVGWTRLAYFGKRLGVDLWGYQAPNGSSIPEAYEYLYPYVLGEKKWDKQQISNVEKALERLGTQIRIAGGIFNVSKYCDVMSKKLNEDQSLETLLVNCGL